MFTLDGRVAAQVGVEYPTRHPAPGQAEQDPSAWWDAAAAGCARLPAEKRRRVAAVGLASHRGGVVPIDGAGRVLAPCMIWMDRRGAAEVDALVRTFGRERVHAVTGLIPDAEFSAGKILWLRSHDPDVFHAARLYLQPRDYLYWRLTGEPATDYTLASRTLLLDINTRAWWPEACAYAGIASSALPPVYPSASAPHRVAADAAAALGIPAGTPVALGAGDRPCEVVGAGAGHGRVMVSTGTTTNVSVPAPAPPPAVDPRVMCSLHAVDGMVLFEQGMSASGSILRWLRDTMLGGRVDYRQLDALAGAVPAGADGLLFLPFMQGARATRWNPDARGAWFGLTEAHAVGALARSVMEGVAFEIRACLAILEQMGTRMVEVVAVGGGARSALWDRILADALGRPVGVPEQTDAASLGAMLLAAGAIGAVAAPEPAVRSANPIARAYRPAPAASGRYREWYDVYVRLYDALRPVFGELARPAEPAG